jgi:hypothetical protein
MYKTRLACLSVFSLALLAGPQVTFAAACCGGSFAAPSLIVGDDKAQVTASYGHSQITDDVGTDTLWRKRSSKESSETWKLDAAHLISDQWQVGLSVPVVRRSRSSAGSTGLGDISGTLGYEFLPEWDYNPWRPRGLGYLQLTAPTGKAINEADAAYQLDSRGRGFWAAGLGTVLTKTLGALDIFASLDAHRSFAKNFQNSLSSGRLEPGFGGSAGFGAGYSVSDFRVGASLAWTYEEAVNVVGTTSSRGAPQRFATASLSGSYLFHRAWAATLTYSDQTKFGAPLNTSLGRGGVLLVQKRWER